MDAQNTADHECAAHTNGIINPFPDAWLLIVHAVELLFHVVFLILCFEVQFDQNRRKKSDNYYKIFVVQPQGDSRDLLGTLKEGKGEEKKKKKKKKQKKI